MTHEFEYSEEYGEKKLTELLEANTGDLQPGPGYNIVLQGVHSTPLQEQELSAFFGTNFNVKTGATINLAYKGPEQGLRLHELTYPLKKPGGVARLIWTDYTGYITLIEPGKGASYTGKKSVMSYRDGHRLMAGYGLTTTAPEEQPLSYKEWRAKALARTQGWGLKETVETPLLISDDSLEIVTLTREERFNAETSKVVQRQSLTRSIITVDQVTGDTDHTDRVIELLSDAEGKTFRSVEHTYHRTEDILSEAGFVISSSDIKPLKLDQKAFDEFNDAIAA